MVRKVLPLILYAMIGWSVSVCAQINADAVMNIGRNALYYEDYALSIQYFNQAIAARPYIYSPYYYRAIAKYYLGDYNGAVGDCTLSIERDPYISEVYRLRAINYIRTANYEAASCDYYTLINERQINDRDVWYNLVLCQFRQNKHTEADHLLDSMIVKWPDYARCYMLKAQIAVAKRDSVLADSLLVHSLSLDSTDVDALSALGVLSLQRQQHSRAEDIYTQAIINSPRTPSLYVNRALARYQQNNLRGAMADYNAALEVAPDNYLAHYNRALLRMHVGENNLAIEDFDYVLACHPNDRLALYNRAVLAQQTGDYRRAIKEFSIIIDEFPYFIEAYVNRAYCYAKVGESRSSDADNRSVINLQLQQAYTHKPVVSPLDSITRDRADADIEDYDKLVTDSLENLAPFYASEYRGRIQNKQVAAEFQPLFALTFFKASNGLASSATKTPLFVEQLNDAYRLYAPLCISVRETPMTDAQCQIIADCRKAVGQKLESSSLDAASLFLHALYLSVERDFESAIQDLNQCVQMCDTSRSTVLTIQPLFLRAYAKARLAEAQLSKKEGGTDASKLQYLSAISDLSLSIEKQAANAILYYNRATLYACSMDYQKAIADYNKALEIDPTIAEAYFNRGLSYVYSGNKEQGVADLSKAGELGLFTGYSLIKQFRK